MCFLSVWVSWRPMLFFFFKQKTAYEMRISDWSSDVCSSDLVVRPLAVLVSTLGGKLSWRERTLIAWIAPRGIVAASVSALFALKLEERGIADAQVLVTLTFLIIISTVLIDRKSTRLNSSH